jgi:CubicO group peptidase (beta-lactamase class C family)
VEVISGKDYESYLKEDVLSKMGITDTHIGGYQHERRANECVYYMQADGNGYANPLREIAGAAGIITSTNQMMRILTFMDGDDTVPDIFSYETLQEMYTPYHYSGTGSYGENYKRYGLGWRMNHSRLFPGSHYHGGNIAGTATFWVGHTETGMSGAIVCNSRAYNSNSSGDIDDNMYLLLDAFFDYLK